MEEIELALKETDPSKSSGLDRLNARILKSVWQWIKFDVWDLFPQDFNSSFIALIPKKTKPMVVSDFRPISLINCSFKLLSKVPANRLKLVLPSLILVHQSNFLKGRQILDSVFIANELTNSLKLGKLEGLVIKLDFEKAFDSIDWPFLFQCLLRMNFGTKWIKWLNQIFESSRMSVLINGSFTKEFKPSRGLRQGDPLSPLLFLIVGEVLHSLLSEAEKKEMFSGVCYYGNSNFMSHLQFADDTVLFIKNDLHSVLGIKSQVLRTINRLKD